MSDMIKMETACYREAVPANKEIVNYALVTISTVNKEERNIPVCHGEMILVLDCSGSMYYPPEPESCPIDKVIDAACQVAQALKPNDRLGIIGFNSKVIPVCGLTSGEARNEILIALGELKEKGGGSTQMAPALMAAMDEINRNAKNRLGARIVILTDGRADDGDETLAFVKSLESQSIASLGFGEFNFDFMTEVCAPSQSICEEVGKKDPSRVAEVFLNELSVAQNTIASNLRLRVKVRNETLLNKCWIAQPRVNDLGKVELGSDRVYEATLPILEQDFGIQVVLALKHLNRAPGKFSAAGLELLYDIPAQDIENKLIEGNVVVEYTTDESCFRAVNKAIAEVHARCLDEERRLRLEDAKERGDLKEMQKQLQTLVRSKNTQLSSMATEILKATKSPSDMSKEMSTQLTQLTKAKGPKQREA